jgi:hypothetical protein
MKRLPLNVLTIADPIAAVALYVRSHYGTARRGRS